MEVVFSREGDRWTALGDAFVVTSATRGEPDQEIREGIVATRSFPRGSSVTVLMACDVRVIPAWMRSYHSRYFNRTVRLDV